MTTPLCIYSLLAAEPLLLRGETMRSLLALQIPEHVASGSGNYHLTPHHHVPIDGGNEYMDGEDLAKNRHQWSRPKLVGVNTSEKHKSSLKKPIPKGGLGTDFSIAV